MNALTVPDEIILTPSVTTIGLMTNKPLLDEAYRLAEIMASSTVTVPKPLQGKIGDCMAIIVQAMQWGMNPWVVAQKTHVVNGTLGYEAQLVNAVVLNSGMVSGVFTYQYDGEGSQLKCRVGATLKGSSELLFNHWLALNSVKTKNSPLWETNPRQQIGYLQVKNWARQYCPGAILGVYSSDELAQSAPVKNMGKIDRVVEPADPAIVDALEKAGESAAALGMESFKQWFTSLDRDSRVIANSFKDELKAVAQAFDTKQNLAADAALAEQDKVSANA